MTYRLDQLPAQPFLDDTTQRELIARVHLMDVDPSPNAWDAEEAQERLVLAFLPAIKRAARSSKVQDPDDALANALEEFLRAVRAYNLDGDVPFHATVGRILTDHISDTDRTNGVIRVKENTAANYWRILRRHDGDVERAYAECRDTTNGMSPMTFLAAHHAISGTVSMDHILAPDAAGVPHPVTPGPEERAVEADLVRWLFTLVSLRQALILKLRYGFLDDDVDAVRLAAGYPTGLDLSDLQVAHAIGASRPAIQREKTKALATMREAMQQLVNDEDAC